MERHECQQNLSAVSTANLTPRNPSEGGDTPVSPENQHSQEGTPVAGIAVIAIGRIGVEILSALSGKLIYLKRSIVIGTDPATLLRIEADEKLIFRSHSINPLFNDFRRDFEAVLDRIDIAFVVADVGCSTNNKLFPIIADVLRAKSIHVITAVVPPISIIGEFRKKTAPNNFNPLRDVSNAVFPIAIAPRLPARLLRQPIDILNQATIAFEHLYLGIVKPAFGPGFVTVDLEDVVSILSYERISALGFGTASDEQAVQKATLEAIMSPLLGKHRLKSASAVCLHLEGDSTHMKCKAIVEMINIVKQVTDNHPDLEVVFGATLSNTLSSNCQVTILASGIHMQ